MTGQLGRFTTRASRALRMLRTHPDLLASKVAARLRARRRAPSGVVDGRIGEVRFRFDMDLDVRVGEMYRRTHSMDVVHALRHLLNPGDVFIDVGANIGYLTAVGCDRVGPSGCVVAFEPVPAYATCVQRLADDNPGYRIEVVPKAVSDREGTASIDVSAIGNIGWNTMVPGLMPKSHRAQTLDVEMVRLDQTLAELEVNNVTVIKIDVEGFEMSVLKSIKGLWDRGERPTIICEINPYAFELAGVPRGALDQLAKRWGYRAVELFDMRTEVELTSVLLDHGDVLLRA